MAEGRVSILDDRLAAIGFGASVRPALGWRVERLDAGRDDASARCEGLLNSRDWSAWLDLLRDRPGPPVYRIRRAS